MLLVALTLALTWGSSEVLAAEQESYWINPAYSHLYADPDQAFLKREKRSGETFECGSYAELQTTLKQQLENRNTAFSLHAVYEFAFNDFKVILDQAFADATDGNDYLRFCAMATHTAWGGWDGNVTVDYEVTYVASYEQEQQVSESVPEILAAILEDGMNDEQKEKAIHDWVVANVEYDTTHEEHSAYAALFLGKTVCQGYSLLIYKMLDTVGIPVRIVNSDTMNHDWNLVNICGHWYHLDATWDDPVPDDPGRVYDTFYNKSDAEIASGDNPHYGWDRSAYPAAPDSYTEGVCGSGNINGTGGIDLADAILALRACTGASADAVQIDADVSGDGRIGMEEVIYVLQSVAGLRD
ncbi:peptidase [Desulfonema ishimotonii]|uniref:Peptidase n=1 Tax=Desulfonema ishimotonii TaxID=45657 RepID=A0A401FZI0_9BACT|nr:peptidase [Desulfonema ishimotonii]